MPCLFSSCFGGAPVRRQDGLYDDDTLRPRRVLIRTSTEKQLDFTYHRASSGNATGHTDEKTALEERNTLVDDFDEDAEERSTFISEKHLEAGVEAPVLVQQEAFQVKRIVRKSIGFRRKKTPQSSPEPLSPHNTGDELHRRAQFEKHIKKLSQGEGQRAWAAEAERRQKWKTDRKNAQHR